MDLAILPAPQDQQHQLGILETGVANKVSGIAVNIADDNAYVDLLCNAMKQGIPVVTFNIDDSRHGAPGSTCRLAFMGQNFIDSGYVLGSVLQRPVADDEQSTEGGIRQHRPCAVV